MPLLKAQCPNCKQWLSVQYSPEMEELMVACPYCRDKKPFKNWNKKDERRNAEEERKRKEEERKRLEAEEERRRQEEIRRRQEEENRRRQEEENRRRQEEENRRRQEEENRRRQEEENRRRQEEENRIRQEEENRRRQEEENRRRQEEENRRRQEEEVQRQRAEQERLYREEQERLRREEEERKRWQSFTIGTLVALNCGNTYSLFPGRNVVGRMANSSTADIQIPDLTGQRRMSRSHLVINVLKENGRFVHYASLNSPSVNRTCVNNMPLIYGQQVLLHSGDIIDLPGESIRFETIENNQEETELGFI